MSEAVTFSRDADEFITGEAVALDVRSTSFLLRAAGAMIDVLVSVALAAVLVLLLVMSAAQTGMDTAAMQAFMIAIIVFSTIVVPTAVELLTRGRSLGRLAIGARIVRDDGGAIGFRHAFIRALVGFFEIYMTLGGGAALVGLLGARSKRIGDMLAGTYSQHERVPRISPAVYPVPQHLTAWAQVADVARLPDRLARRIAQFLSQAARMTPHSRARLAHDLANEASAHVAPLPQTDPLSFLYAVAALRRERSYRALMLERERLQRLQPLLHDNPHSFPARVPQHPSPAR
ncbi:RDD family protein [Paramicrobacterium agarici]|uniref:RDD family protein n=1 Tax=Paramicrobacterium agarici TaxID=630514 RepID=UPI001152AE49|nr:RDD family protein [Microbacterium agarici]TQO23912.1 putative RDD family membrane protein YckC [Microbacterium agarici]